MRRSMIAALVVGSAFLIHVVPAHAQRWGREPTPRSGVCFYEDINYGGRYFCSPVGASTAQVSNGNNDSISSIRLFGGAAVTVYRDQNFRGQSRVIDTNMSDLRSLGFNDRISSYQVDSSRVSSARDTREWRNAPYGPTVQSNGTRWSYRDAEQVVRRSYRSILGRDPDPSGLRYWTQQVVDSNWTQRDLEYALRQSDEYRQLRQARRR